MNVHAISFAIVSSSWALAQTANAAAIDKEGPSSTVRPVQVGAVGGIGAPRVFSAEGFIVVAERLVFGLEYATLPTASFGGVKVGASAVSGDVRIYPFRRGPFFVGARLGRQTLDASAEVVVSGYGTYSGSTHQTSWFLGPRVGLFWVSQPGLTIGTSVGLQIPLSHEVSTALPSGLPARTAVVPSFIDALGGGSVIPTLDLLQLGVAI